MSNLMATVQRDAQLAAYLQDHYSVSKRSPEREYFWGIFFGVKPEYGKALVLSAINQRNQPQAGQQVDASNTLIIQKDIHEKMLAVPKFNCKLDPGSSCHV